MTKLEETILALREKGYGCSQATAVALNREFHTIAVPEFVLKAATSGFRGGIGRTFDEGTCGALTGAVLALGLMIDNESLSADLSRQLFNEFKQKFGTVCCGRITDEHGHKRCNECCLFAGTKAADLYQTAKDAHDL